MRKAYSLVLFAIAVMSAATAFAQDSNFFHIRVGSALTGTEEYQIAKEADGWHITGKLHVERATGSYDVTHDELLAADRTLIRYRLETRGQVIEAWRDGEKIQMKVSAGEQTQSSSVPFTTPATVVDNLVTAHMQVLLDRFAGTGEAPAAVLLVVPQVMAAIPGKLSKEGDEPATFSGKPMRVRKLTLEAGNLLTELWAEIDTNRLMRMTVPVQKVEIVREGFALVPRAEPARAEPATFIERPVDLATGGLSLPATLCLPAAAKGKVALVVLVHGSGPNDRDETIGPNKPFRDIAEGFAAAGIATLRYDKRTFALKNKLDLKTLTVEEETIADAVAAVRFARTLPEIDPTRVFVLGHSQGAMFAPTIADRARARGAILMAPAERPPDEVVTEQLAFQMKVAGSSQADIDARVNELKTAFGRIRSGEAHDEEIVLGASARYWRDYLARDPRGTLASLQAPVLILQGGKDIQVQKVDYDLAVEAVASKPPAMREAHFFPALNHLFIEVQGEQPTGAEYGRPGHVAPEVIETITKWVETWK